MRWKILAGAITAITVVALTAVAVPGVGADPAGVTFSALGQPDTSSHTLGSRCANANARFNQHDFGGGFATDGPTGMALTSTGRLFVLDDGGQRVLSWPNADALTACQAADKVIGAGNLSGPEGVAVGSDGALYVADTLAHVIDIFRPDANGNYPATPNVQLGQLGTSGNAGNQFTYPRGMALDASGRLLVADDYNNRIQIFYPPLTTGQFANDSIGAGNDGGLGNPKDIELVDNQLFVADFDNNRVLRFTGPFDNPATVYTSSATFTGVTNPVNLTVGPDKTLYVTGAGPHPEVDAYAHATTSTGAAAPDSVYTFGGLVSPGPDNAAGEPLDVVATTGGRLLLADYGGYRVLIENPAGGFQLTVTSPPPPNGRIQSGYKYKFTASGGTGALKWAFGGGTLPDGLVITPSGILQGTPTESGQFTFTVTVHDSSKPDLKFGHAQISLTMDPMEISFAPKGKAVNPVQGDPYSGKFANEGGKKPVTFTRAGGTIPPGLTLKPNGVLSGTPSVSGTFTLTVLATDAVGNTAQMPFGFAVTPFQITSSDGFSCTVSKACKYKQTVLGGSGALHWSVQQGALPPGMAVNPKSGLISGTPTATGLFTGVIYVQDSQTTPGPASATHSFSISVQ
jgi:sugar lactone lactonase YvrE